MLKIGALWQKKDRRGSTMFSGEVECPHCKKKTRLFGFVNKYKNEENRQPNYNLFQPDEIPQDTPEEVPAHIEEGKSEPEEKNLPF